MYATDNHILCFNNQLLLTQNSFNMKFESGPSNFVLSGFHCKLDVGIMYIMQSVHISMEVHRRVLLDKEGLGISQCRINQISINKNDNDS